MMVLSAHASYLVSNQAGEDGHRSWCFGRGTIFKEEIKLDIRSDGSMQKKSPTTSW